MAEVPGDGYSARRAFGWGFAGTASTAAVQLLVVVMLARRAGESAVGDWTLALAITSPFVVFGQLKLRQVVATDVRDEHSFRRYLLVRASMVGGCLVLAVVGTSVVFDAATTRLVASMAVLRLFESISDLVYGLDYRLNRATAAGLSQLVRSGAGLGAVTVVLALDGGVVPVALALAGVSLVGAAVDLVRCRAEGGDATGRRTESVRTMTVRWLPLGLVSAIGVLQVNIPRYVLESERSRDDLGAYGAISSWLLIGNLVVGAAATAASPQLARDVAAGDLVAFWARIRRLVTLGLALAMMALVASAVIGRQLLQLVYGDDIADQHHVLTILAASSGLIWSYVYLGTALDVLRACVRVQPIIHLISSAVVFIGCLALVPSHGISGAAFAVLASAAIECVMYLVAVRRAVDRLGTSPS